MGIGETITEEKIITELSKLDLANISTDKLDTQISNLKHLKQYFEYMYARSDDLKRDAKTIYDIAKYNVNKMQKGATELKAFNFQPIAEKYYTFYNSTYEHDTKYSGTFHLPRFTATKTSKMKENKVQVKGKTINFESIKNMASAFKTFCNTCEKFINKLDNIIKNLTILKKQKEKLNTISESIEGLTSNLKEDINLSKSLNETSKAFPDFKIDSNQDTFKNNLQGILLQMVGLEKTTQK